MWANGLFDEADAAYREAIATEPESSRARFGLARSLATRSRLDEALKEALQTVGRGAAGPRNPRARRPHLRAAEPLRGIRRCVRTLHRAAADDRSQLRWPRSLRARSGCCGASRAACRWRSSDASGRVYRVRSGWSNRKIVLQGRVNRTPVEFVLDTGSERTGVSDVTARRAGVASITATLDRGRRRCQRCAGSSSGAPTASKSARCACATSRSRSGSVVRGALPRWQSESFSPLSLGYSVVVDYQRREVLLARTLPEGRGGFRAADAHEPPADGPGHAQFHVSGVLRR